MTDSSNETPLSIGIAQGEATPTVAISDQPIFHLAFPIGNIPQTEEFYVTGLGCVVGRVTDRSIILGIHGHQLVGHVTTPLPAPQKGIYPRHFGLIFPELQQWEALHQQATAHQLTFHQRPKRRFEGEITDHYSFFLADPFGNLLEFKYYVYPEAIFGAREFDRIGDSVEVSNTPPVP
jgi:uncharacterized protein